MGSSAAARGVFFSFICFSPHFFLKYKHPLRPSNSAANVEYHDFSKNTTYFSPDLRKTWMSKLMQQSSSLMAASRSTPALGVFQQ